MRNEELSAKLAERLGSFDESANALADYLQTRDVTRKTDQCMVEAAKCMFFKLLGEASDDLDRAILQPQEDHRAHATRIEAVVLAPRHRAEVLVLLTEAATEKPCSRPETENEVLRSSSETNSPSHGPLEHVAGRDFRKQLEITVPLYGSGVEVRVQDVFAEYDDIELALH